METEICLFKFRVVSNPEKSLSLKLSNQPWSFKLEIGKNAGLKIPVSNPKLLFVFPGFKNLEFQTRINFPGVTKRYLTKRYKFEDIIMNSTIALKVAQTAGIRHH